MARPTKYKSEYCDQSGIYALHCPDSGEIRYVGRSKNIANRVKRHLSLKTKEKTHYGNWIRSLDEKPTVSILEITDDTVRREVFWIRELRSQGADLVNTGSGGEGATDDPVQCLIRKMNNMFRGNQKIEALCMDIKERYSCSEGLEREEFANKARRLLEMP